eukprot:2349443-Rhodomonas_salina.1
MLETFRYAKPHYAYAAMANCGNGGSTNRGYHGRWYAVLSVGIVVGACGTNRGYRGRGYEDKEGRHCYGRLHKKYAYKIL